MAWKHCPHCEMSFALQVSLNEHIATVHRQPDVDDSSVRDALHRIADEIAGFEPVPSTFKGVRDDAVTGARVTLRMVVELIRERADGKPSATKQANPAHLAELGLGDHT